MCDDVRSMFNEWLIDKRLSRYESYKLKEISGKLTKTPIESKLQEQEFLYEWFNVWNYSYKFEIAYKYEVINLLQNDKFETRNKVERIYDENYYRLLQAIYWRDDKVCAYCNNRVPKNSGHIDHVIPRSAWPEKWLWLADDGSNLVVSCVDCNSEKSNAYGRPEASLQPIFFDCIKDKSEEYSCCVSVRNKREIEYCSDCTQIRVVCRIHEEQWLPICWLPALKDWFGHA